MPPKRINFRNDGPGKAIASGMVIAIAISLACILINSALALETVKDLAGANQIGGANGTPPAGHSSTNILAYHLRAGGPNNYVGLTNSPASNHVSIAFSSRNDNDVVFCLTNSEPHAILLWNVRVQIKSSGAGTDGFGWDTVYDDYPSGTPKFPSTIFPSRGFGEFVVPHAQKGPWRVCILYSMDWKDGGKEYGGNYEVIGKSIAE